MGSERPLEGKVALVAGASRGAGRGIACMLGEAGATVYCSGRSGRGAGRSKRWWAASDRSRGGSTSS